MRNISQVILGFLAALLSAAVILGSLSLSLSESGLKLALRSTPTRTPGLRISTPTRPVETATALPGETGTVSPFTPPLAITLTPMLPSATLPPTSCQLPSAVGMVADHDTGWRYIRKYREGIQYHDGCIDSGQLPDHRGFNHWHDPLRAWHTANGITHPMRTTPWMDLLHGAAR